MADNSPKPGTPEFESHYPSQAELDSDPARNRELGRITLPIFTELRSALLELITTLSKWILTSLLSSPEHSPFGHSDYKGELLWDILVLILRAKIDLPSMPAEWLAPT
jgi:hypothetical protein